MHKNFCYPLNIPTIFGKELSYYETVCHLQYEIECLKKKICNDEQTCPPPQINHFKKLKRDVYCSNYGRKKYPNAQSQGFCTLSINDTWYFVQGIITTNSQSIEIFNAKTGEIYTSAQFTNLGHVNSICTDGEFIYVATSGGSSTLSSIVKLNKNLNIIATYELPNLRPYAITYNKGIFYILGANNVGYITKDFENLAPYQIPGRNNAVNQGIFSDDNYLFINRGNWYENFSSNNYVCNTIDVFDHQFNYVQTLYFHLINEIEECDFMDGELVISTLTGTALSSAIYFITDVYESCKTYWGDNKRVNPGFTIANFHSHVYVNENYNGFLQDGSSSHPFTSFYQITENVYPYTLFMDIDLMSDITVDYGINIGKSDFCNIEINGHGYSITGNIIVRRGANLYITNATLKGINTLLDIEFANSVQLDTVTFDMEGATTGIRSQGAVLHMSRITFINSSSSLINIYAIEGAVRINNSLIDNGGLYKFASEFNIEGDIFLLNNGLTGRLCNDFFINPNGTIIGLNTTKGLNDLTLPGTYYNINYEGAPTGYTYYSCKVESVGRMIIKQTIVSSNGYEFSRLCSGSLGQPPTSFSSWKQLTN